MSRENLIEKVQKQLQSFEITEEEILRIMELEQIHRAERRRTLPPSKGCIICLSEIRDSEEARNAAANLLMSIEELSVHKRHDLMCLLYLGRDIGYYGFTRSVVSSFVAYAEEWGKVPLKRMDGCFQPDYLAGKPISDWMSNVKRELNAGVLPDDEWTITLYDCQGEKTKESYRTLEKAWARYHVLVSPEGAERYSGVYLEGYSWTGRAITRIARTEFGC